MLLLFAIGISAYALPAIDFGPLDHTYNLTIENQTYAIRYGFSSDRNGTAVIESMSANYSSKSIAVIVNDNSTTISGNRSFVYFVIELPRNIINANTSGIAGGCRFFAPANNTVFWAQEHDIDYNIAVSRLSEGNTTIYNGNQGELCGPDTRTLSIEYPTGSKTMIIIQGNVMIPEFGSSFVVPTFILLLMIGGVLAVERFWELKLK